MPGSANPPCYSQREWNKLRLVTSQKLISTVTINKILHFSSLFITFNHYCSVVSSFQEHRREFQTKANCHPVHQNPTHFIIITPLRVCPRRSPEFQTKANPHPARSGQRGV